MSQQKSLPLDGTEAVHALWIGLPAQVRDQVVILYASLIARNVRGEAISVPQSPASLLQRFTQEAPATAGVAPGPAADAKQLPGSGLDSPGAPITAPASTNLNEELLR